MMPMRGPQTMRAWAFEKFGDPLEEIKFRSDVMHPPLAPSQVRILVRCAGLNPIDYKLVEFGDKFLPKNPSHNNPVYMGFDVAGTVVEVGESVSNLSVDDAVYAMAPFGATGTFADYVVVDAKHVARKPKNMNFREAAGVPLAAQTSYQALVTYGKLKQGDRVLILGGSGGTGTFAIQIAKALGASFVATTTSARNAELVKSLGADQVIDYSKEQYGEKLAPRSIDLIFDCSVDALSWNEEAQRVLKPDTGIFVTIDPFAKLNASSTGTKSHQIMTDSNTEDLDKLRALIEEGKVKTQIDSTFKLEELPEAIKKQKDGHARGKIIITVASEE
ncbi:hypothetical protein Poli38472_009999 [Pythium oligandrum]|uniref:Enoyl reductase (ER) domain-containing protein n=1 Tax=Pythium oligandrum TaxID=41045 RepID=A0A8K1FCL3_PYTOL|nr:hypothetical protein Poli38472_009999 [Pythium oligandrum]|eukprot:TMW58440.1 hypothetical protein Poli38472_009999 [Pythium oligandrum]